MKRKITFAVIGLMMALAMAFQATNSRAGQTSSNPCRNKCEQGYRSCVAAARNPGGLNQCKRALDSCLATCR